MSNSSKLKLIVMLSRFPFPLEKGDKLRAYYQIIELSKSFDITLICISDHQILHEHHTQLKKHCASIHTFVLPRWKSLANSFIALLGKKPIQVGYFFSRFIKKKVDNILAQEKPDHIFCQLVRASEYVKDYHNCPKTLDYMDAFSVGIERRINLEPFYLKWLFKLESRRLKRYEQEIFDYFELHTIISEQDSHILGTSVSQTLSIVPNGVSLHFINFISKKEAEFDLVFVGNLNYPPNVQAVKFIVNEILPSAFKLGKNLNFLAAGADPSKELVELIYKSKSTELRSNVADIREAYCAGKMFIAPMQIGTGLQNKLLEAMALGLPSITSKLANNALNAKVNEEIIVAESVQEYVQSIDRLLNPTLSAKIGKNGKCFIEKHFNWESSMVDLINNMRKAQIMQKTQSKSH